MPHDQAATFNQLVNISLTAPGQKMTLSLALISASLILSPMKECSKPHSKRPDNVPAHGSNPFTKETAESLRPIQLLK